MLPMDLMSDLGCVLEQVPLMRSQPQLRPKKRRQNDMDCDALENPQNQDKEAEHKYLPGDDHGLDILSGASKRAHQGLAGARFHVIVTFDAIRVKIAGNVRRS